jgi:hypothetical protein
MGKIVDFYVKKKIKLSTENAQVLLYQFVFFFSCKIV